MPQLDFNVAFSNFIFLTFFFIFFYLFVTFFLLPQLLKMIAIKIFYLKLLKTLKKRFLALVKKQDDYISYQVTKVFHLLRINQSVVFKLLVIFR